MNTINQDDSKEKSKFVLKQSVVLGCGSKNSFITHPTVVRKLFWYGVSAHAQEHEEKIPTSHIFFFAFFEIRLDRETKRNRASKG